MYDGISMADDESIISSLQSLIDLLEKRTNSIVLGELDDDLDDLVKSPIPHEYQTLTQQLKCNFPQSIKLPQILYANRSSSVTGIPRINDASEDKIDLCTQDGDDAPTTVVPIGSVENKTAIDVDNRQLNLQSETNRLNFTSVIEEPNHKSHDVVVPSSSNGIENRTDLVTDPSSPNGNRSSNLSQSSLDISPKKSRSVQYSAELVANVSSSSSSMVVLEVDVTTSVDVKSSSTMSTTKNPRVKELLTVDKVGLSVDDTSVSLDTMVVETVPSSIPSSITSSSSKQTSPVKKRGRPPAINTDTTTGNNHSSNTSNLVIDEANHVSNIVNNSPSVSPPTISKRLSTRAHSPVNIAESLPPNTVTRLTPSSKQNSVSNSVSNEESQGTSRRSKRIRS